nr:hypothetical protein [Terriglobus tenax]
MLQVHMAYCDSCRRTFEEYRLVAHEVIPAMAASAAESANGPRESAASLDDAERRLMNRLDAVPRPQPSRGSKVTPWRILSGTFAAGVLVLVAFASAHFIRGKGVGRREPSASTTTGQLPAPQAAPRSNTEESPVLQRDANEVAGLQQQIRDLASQSAKSSSASAVLQQLLQKEQAQREQLASEKDELTRQLANAQAGMQALQEKLRSADSKAEQQAVQVAALETKVHALNVSLDETKSTLNDRERMLALDKDFLAHDRDIRDVVGARNLYIADIYDTTESGKTAKPFGRIFYTQNRSLVFYGFDLEKQQGLGRSVNFQAWGSGTDRQPVSLGLFYQDDSHQRWVVRCSDAKTLARLNMVFVTVEPPGGSGKPTGKQLLRAYLQINPNHP